MTPPKSPNWHLVVPNGWAHTHALGRAPRFDVPLDLLREALVAVAAQEPRCHLLALDQEARQAEFEQKSRLFGFADRIVVEFVALGNGASTLALYSYSLKGYWDLGVNRKRLERWLAALPSQVAHLVAA
ncbi:DUF1499 domain-containing protein [Algihabitans albus]|uniref:DUF1499 domain-containing protein n=1 Tax=Algihabitans albus TaxID=2164067 RepID=UPI0013C2D400|nr:DUF1499 domain-containing protein [Algihabitans albus]